MGAKEEIHALLPDNTTRQISEKDLRDAFDIAVDNNPPEDKVIQIGPVTATTTSIDLALHSSGENKFLKDGQILVKNTADHWDFPAVTSEKIFTIYVINDPAIVHLALDGEDIPVGALVVRSFIISASGIVENDTDYKLYAENAWRNYTIPNNDLFTIDMGNGLATNFSISLAVGVTAPKIGLIKQKAGKSFRPGVDFLIRNNSAIDIELVESEYTDGFFKFLTFENSFAKGNGDTSLKEQFGLVTPLNFSQDIDLTPYALDADLDTEIVNRALEDAKKLDKPLAPNNTSERLIEANGGTTSKGNYQRNKQFFISLPATVSEDWKGCIVFFTSSGNLTVPTGLTVDFTFNGVVDNGVTLTPAITSPMTWLGTAPTAFSGVAIFTMVRRDGTNNFQILGI